MKAFAFAASLREGSYHQGLIELAKGLSQELHWEVDLARFKDFEVPSYSGDREKEGFPSQVLEFCERLENSNALLIASPEYNYSMSGVLKNLIDWVSRVRPMPWKGKKIFLMSTSPGSVGGVRGLWQLRIPLEGCGAYVYPAMYSLPFAGDSIRLDADGRANFKDQKSSDRLKDQLREFYQFVEKMEQSR